MNSRPLGSEPSTLTRLRYFPLLHARCPNIPTITVRKRGSNPHGNLDGGPGRTRTYGLRREEGYNLQQLPLCDRPKEITRAVLVPMSQWNLPSISIGASVIPATGSLLNLTFRCSQTVITEGLHRDYESNAGRQGLESRHGPAAPVCTSINLHCLRYTVKPRD